MFATLKMFFVCVGLGVPAGVIGLPWTLLRGDISLLYRWGTRIALAGVAAAGIRIVQTGMENIPAGQPCLFFCNHVSNLDPPIVIPSIPGRTSVMLKKELMSIPLLGPAMRLGRFVPVERENRAGAVRAIRAASDAIESGLHMVVFVEGTRSRTGRLLPFKKGPFHLAQHTGVPIVPMVVVGTESMLEKGSWSIHPGVAQIRYLEAMDPKAYASREELMQAVRQRMIDALPEHMRPLE